MPDPGRCDLIIDTRPLELGSVMHLQVFLLLGYAFSYFLNGKMFFIACLLASITQSYSLQNRCKYWW